LFGLWILGELGIDGIEMIGEVEMIELCGLGNGLIWCIGCFLGVVIDPFILGEAVSLRVVVCVDCVLSESIFYASLELFHITFQFSNSGGVTILYILHKILN
jgi:hypothetical protein